MIDSGCEIIFLEPEEKLKFRETVQPLYQKYCGDHLDLIKAIQAEAAAPIGTGEESSAPEP